MFRLIENKHLKPTKPTLMQLPEHLRTMAQLRYDTNDILSLIEMLGDDRDAIWEIAFALLSEIGQESVPYLLAALNSPSQQTRMLAVTLLGRSRDMRLLKSLMWMLRDENHEVREAARTATKKLLQNLKH